MTRWSGACVGLLLLGLTTLCASAAGPKRVLILEPFERDVAPFSAAASAFRSTLAQDLGGSVDIYEVPLDLARFAGPEGKDSLVVFLEGRLKSHPVDLVVPVGGPSMQFAARYRERLFPDTPVLILGSDSRQMPPGLLRTNTTLVTQKINLSGMVEDILQLQPQTTNIVVVFGASALENFWVNECRREFQSFTNRVEFTWFNELPLEQILKRCAALPPHSFILHELFVVDAAGVPCEKNEALRRLHQVANAPLFGYFASESGLGTIGGRLYQDSEIGAQGARTAIRILRGERPESIPPQVFEAAGPVYDWRELQRWHIPETRLPAGSIIQFRQPGFWELYRWWIGGVGAFCLLQSALIVVLLVNRAKRRQGEAEATLIADISSKFVNLPPGEVDQEILDAQCRICELLGLDVSSLWEWSVETPNSFTLTHFYGTVEGPRPSERMDASEHFPWCQQQLLANRIVNVSSLEKLPAEAARDRETWRQFGIKTSLTIPLAVGGGPPIGAVSFNTVRKERDWPDVLVKRLQLVAQVFTNALARKRASQDLHESEERMTLAAEAAQFGVWGWNIDSDRVWGSERWQRLFGFASGEVVNFEMVIQRIHPDDRKTVEQEVQRALVNVSDYWGDFRVVLPDGTRRWIVSRGRAYLNANGTPARMLGTAIDITYRKQMELALKESEERFRQVAETVADFIWEVDTEGLYTYASPSVEKILGYTPEELVGKKHFYDLFDPSVREELKAAAFQAFAERQMFRDFPNLNVSKSGNVVHLETSGVPMLDPTGNLAGYRGADTDVTVRKQAEAELLRERAELAHVARVSTMGELAASVAHELNQPLGAILANAEAAELFLQQEPPALGELRAILADIRKDDERAGEVIRRMRALLRKRELERQPIEINSLVEDVLQLVCGDAALRGISLTADLGPVLPKVSGDRVHLQQVLLNLILNGMDAMAGQPREERRISVRTRSGADGRVELAVTDSGQGIEPDKLPRLFDPFYTTKPNGMGMGLSIARTIIEAHHGRIWAENNAPGGAVFRIALPVSGEGQVAK